MYVCMYVCMYLCMHACMHVRTYVGNALRMQLNMTPSVGFGVPGLGP